jgi:heat shock protein HtpX
VASNLYTNQDTNIRKTWFLMAGFLVAVIAIGWFFSQIWGSPIILYLAVGVAILTNFFSYWYSDKLVIKLTGAKLASRENFFDFYTVAENLSIAAGLPLPKLFVINDPAPNAFATGRDPAHAAIAVTSGLLGILDRSELEGVVAHELSHVGNRDILVSTVAVVLVGFVAILSDIFLRSRLWGFHGRDRQGRIGLVVLALAILAAILAPIAASLLRLAISRRREFLADASGALLTRYPEGLASALRKISQSGAPLRRASNATAHLFIANPFSGRGGLSKLFMTHPPVDERIKALLQ